MDYLLIPKELRDALLEYLGRRPYHEVAMAMQALMQLKAPAVKEGQVNEERTPPVEVG